MRQLPPRRALRFAVVLAALGVAAGFGSAAGCAPDTITVWLCLNPVTGKEDGSIFDPNHYVDGMADPCHCYDPCGPEKSCPIVVDAGPLPPGCPAPDGDAGGGG